MVVLETCVALPIVAVLASLTKKVVALRETIDTHEATIQLQEQTLTTLRQQVETSRIENNGTSSSGGGTTSTVAGTAVVIGAVALAGVGLAANVYLLFASRSGTDRRGSIATLSDVEPPGGSRTYTGRPAAGDADACIVCFANQRDTLTLPCRHLAMCWTCAKRVTSMTTPSGAASCPTCRAPIEQLTFTYVS